MRVLIWLLRGVVFVALFGLAIKNSGAVDLRLYFGAVWQASLSVVILACFAAGAMVGVTAAFATVIRQRREIARLSDELRVQSLTHPAVPVPARRRSLEPADSVGPRSDSAAEVADISAIPVDAALLRECRS